MSNRRGTQRVVVVGASVAGVTACVALRDSGYQGEIILLGEERHGPYSRPPLSKQLLCGAQTPDEIGLADAPRLETLLVEQKRGQCATGLDLAARTIELDGLTRLPFDGLVIATGARARQLSGQRTLDGLHTLRTLDDALALRRVLRRANHLVIVGAGFIGLEVASSARALGVATTVVETAPAPLSRIFDAELGGWFSALHEEHGVDVRCGAVVRDIRQRDGAVSGVVFSSHDGGGEVSLDADVILVGIGATPATDWLEGAGIDLADGVLCDSTLQAAPGVYAAGDVARFDHPVFGVIRVEHWTTARDQGRAAGRNLAAEMTGRPAHRRAADDVPYFWSDQHGTKIQLAGWAPTSDEFEVVPSPAGRCVLFGLAGKVVAAMGWGSPAFVAKQRRAIANQLDFAEAVKLGTETTAVNLASEEFMT